MDKKIFNRCIPVPDNASPTGAKKKSAENPAGPGFDPDKLVRAPFRPEQFGDQLEYAM